MRAADLESVNLTLPTNLLPYDNAVVTVPMAFSWTPGLNNDAIYLNVSTEPNLEPINVINWADDGSHYFCAEDVAKFQALKGRTLYWQLVADHNGQRIKTPIRRLTVGDVSLDPYYNFIHMGWPGGVLGWDPHDLASIRASDLKVIVAILGSRGRTADRKLGFSFLVPYFFTGDINHYKQLLNRLFEVAEETDLPVLIGLDGYTWWRGRPDLWNWWDERKAGYNPDNTHNVEWTSWSPDDAVRSDAWRNWESPFELQEPHPNLTSPAVIEASQKALKELVLVIKAWYDGLPEAKKFLLGGIRIGSEVGIGINYYYPKLGGDPSSPLEGRQIGYAAVKTAGLSSSGPLTQADVTRAVQLYMTELSRTVYETGIPRRKIFTHCGAHKPDSGAPLAFATAGAALNAYAHPGWSFYTYEAGPQGLEGLADSLNTISSNSWGGAEWGGPGENRSWQDLLRDFQQYHNNKFINSFHFLDPAQACALKAEIDRMSFWIHPPVLHTEVQGNTATLTWSAPSQAAEVYLNVTTDPRLKVDGSFEMIDVANECVTSINTWMLNSLGPGTYYCKLVADGHGRRVISDLAVFKI